MNDSSEWAAGIQLSQMESVKQRTEGKKDKGQNPCAPNSSLSNEDH